MKVYKATTIFLIICLLTLSIQGTGQTTLYAVSKGDDSLRTIDPSNGMVLTAIRLELPGKFINRSTGLAIDPTTGLLYGMLHLDAQYGRQLVQINPATGDALSIGDTGDKFSGIVFDSAGTLYGVTGDGSLTPESLHSLSIVDATTTLIMALGNGGKGEAIGYNSDNGMLYHASGNKLDTSRIFEVINPVTLSITDIPISGPEYLEATSMVYDGGGNFLISGGAATLYRIDTSGNTTSVNSLSFFCKGLAFSIITATPDPLLAPGFEIEIYPNPFSATATIHSDSPISSYRIFGINGQLVRQKEGLTAKSAQIERGNLPNGMYFIEVAFRQGIIAHQKVIIH